MARWEPDARGRLLSAAIELFTDRGYDSTTAAQIAEHAGLTKTTLFRHFADKREILFQGQESLVALAVDAVRSAPPDTEPFAVLRGAVLALCTPHDTHRREPGRRLNDIIATSSELSERAVHKRSVITDALRHALTERLDDARQGAVLADVGVRAYYDGFTEWITGTEDGPLADVVDGELDAYRSALHDLARITHKRPMRHA